MKIRKATNYIIIHSSATTPGMDIGAKEIKGWHVDERGWSDIGYHFVIRRDGRLEKGRAENLQGAHCKGHNWDSVGICLVGGVDHDGITPRRNFTPNQMYTLIKLIITLNDKYKKTMVVGHRDLAMNRTACPSFNVKEWFSGVVGL